MRGLAISSSSAPSCPLKPKHQLIKSSLGAQSNKDPERQCRSGRAHGPGEVGAPCQVAKLQTGPERWSRELARGQRWGLGVGGSSTEG